MELLLEKIGSNLKYLREKLGFSQEFVAKELGLTRQAIIGIESGKRKIDSFELFSLADLYGIEANEIISGKLSEIPQFEMAVMHFRNTEKLSEQSKKSLLEFKKICEDFDSLKRL
ncbi:MAG: helix-turn-helix transcriptional regulator [Candidatus Berkelbacteria bacterium]|nr:helix-turn-helix transcriptional regulator [Candidatus Berkelbacteria bacterium]